MSTPEHTALGFLMRDARSLGHFDATGLVVYACVDCDYSTGPHRPGSSRAKEAMRQHQEAKHAPIPPEGGQA